MILLKAIGKTLLSIFKWIFIFGLIIAMFILFIFMVTNPAIAKILGDILIGSMAILLAWVSIWAIKVEIKDNYEKYARKSIKTEKEYKINYNLICKRERYIKGKTKQQAIYKLFNQEPLEDSDSYYKIKKVRETN